MRSVKKTSRQNLLGSTCINDTSGKPLGEGVRRERREGSTLKHAYGTDLHQPNTDIDCFWNTHFKWKTMYTPNGTV